MKTFFGLLRRLWLIAILGLIVRLFLMPITLHPDLWAISFSEYLFSDKGVINIYDYLANLPQSSALITNYGRNFFTYPPLTYFSLGVFGLILKPFFDNDLFNNLAQNLPNILSDSRLYWHLFLTKLPYLFFDFGILFVLVNIFDDERKKKLSAILWLFNPLVLYTSYMIGQFDVMPVFFTVFSLYLIKKNRWGWAAVSLGVGGAYKMFPLFFVPFLAMSGGENKFQKLKLLVIGFIPYFLSIIPFFGSVNFRQNVLFSDQSQKMLFAKIPVSGAEYLSVFVVVYILLVSLTLVKRLDLWKWFLMVMILFFSITHYHPQWFLWISPLLIIFITNYKNYRFLPVVLLICWFLIMMLFEPSLSISLFAPVEKNLQNFIPLSQTLDKFYDVFVLKSLLRSVFAGVSLVIAILLFKKDELA